MDAHPIPIERLLAHREWVRSVARAVVGDPNAADDVEQETWLAALSSPPRDEPTVRGWFRVVLRNRARRVGRTETRRGRRESVAARPEAIPSTADLAELADTHRRVVQAVVDLDEPYRGTILLRYFEGLAVEDVAARTSVPLDTARSRISRGLAKLRERLARELGTDDRPWALALAPLIAAPRGSTVAAAAKGGVVMASTKTMAAVAGAVLLAAGIGAAVVANRAAHDGAVVAAAPDAAVATSKSDADKSKRAAPPPRTPRQRAAEDPAPVTTAEAPKPRVLDETVSQKLDRVRISLDQHEMQVFDALAEFAARTGVEVAVSQEAEARGIRGVSMSAQLEDVSGKAALKSFTRLSGLDYVIEEPRVVIVPKGVTRDPAKPLITLPPWTPPTPVTVVGRVTDADGVAVVGAEVVQIRSSEQVVATTDVAGRYEVKLTKPLGSLEAHAPGQLPSLAVSVDGQPGSQVTCDLATRGVAGSVSVHVATDADGAAVAKTLVSLGSRQDLKATLPDGRPAVQRALLRYTDEKGVATFAAVSPGSSAVVVQVPGYERFEGTIEAVAGKASPVLEVRLVKKPSLEERLKGKRASLNSPGLRLSDILGYLHTLTGVVFVVDPALAETLGGRTITLTVTDRPLDELLRELCAQIGNAKYELREKDDAVWITVDKR
jgi:RNA polymerase sigma-70 factor (ECF subfamily)